MNDGNKFAAEHHCAECGAILCSCASKAWVEVARLNDEVDRLNTLLGEGSTELFVSEKEVERLNKLLGTSGE